MRDRPLGSWQDHVCNIQDRSSNSSSSSLSSSSSPSLNITIFIFINRNIEPYPPNHPHRCRPAQAGPLSPARAEACSECLLVKFAKILAPNPPTIFQASANWFYVDGPNTPEPASNASVGPTLNHTPEWTQRCAATENTETVSGKY